MYARLKSTRVDKIMLEICLLKIPAYIFNESSLYVFIGTVHLSVIAKLFVNKSALNTDKLFKI